MEKDNRVVYRHNKNTDGTVFYIGIGTKRRPYSKQRSVWWEKTVAKHGYNVDILAENISREDACELEELLISEYGRKDLGLGNLINMTDGGEGSLGNKHSDETRAKMSKSRKGKNHPMYGRKQLKESRAKMSQARKGKPHTEEHNRKISEGGKGRVIPEDVRKRTSKTLKGHPVSDETKRKIKEKAGKKVINIVTKEAFNSIKEAAKENNISYDKLYKRLNGKTKNDTDFILKNKKIWYIN